MPVSLPLQNTAWDELVIISGNRKLSVKELQNDKRMFIKRFFGMFLLGLAMQALLAQSHGEIIFPDHPDYAWLVDQLGKPQTQAIQQEFFRRFPEETEAGEALEGRSKDRPYTAVKLEGYDGKYMRAYLRVDLQAVRGGKKKRMLAAEEMALPLFGDNQVLAQDEVPLIKKSRQFMGTRYQTALEQVFSYAEGRYIIVRVKEKPKPKDKRGLLLYRIALNDQFEQQQKAEAEAARAQELAAAKQAAEEAQQQEAAVDARWNELKGPLKQLYQNPLPAFGAEPPRAQAVCIRDCDSDEAVWFLGDYFWQGNMQEGPQRLYQISNSYAKHNDALDYFLRNQEKLLRGDKKLSAFLGMEWQVEMRDGKVQSIRNRWGTHYRLQPSGQMVVEGYDAWGLVPNKSLTYSGTVDDFGLPHGSQNQLALSQGSVAENVTMEHGKLLRMVPGSYRLRYENAIWEGPLDNELRPHGTGRWSKHQSYVEGPFQHGKPDLREVVLYYNEPLGTAASYPCYFRGAFEELYFGDDGPLFSGSLICAPKADQNEHVFAGYFVSVAVAGEYRGYELQTYPLNVHKKIQMVNGKETVVGQTNYVMITGQVKGEDFYQLDERYEDLADTYLIPASAIVALDPKVQTEFAEKCETWLEYPTWMLSKQESRLPVGNLPTANSEYLPGYVGRWSHRGHQTFARQHGYVKDKNYRQTLLRNYLEPAEANQLHGELAALLLTTLEGWKIERENTTYSRLIRWSKTIDGKPQEANLVFYALPGDKNAVMMNLFFRE